MPLHHFISYSAVDGAQFALRPADALTGGASTGGCRARVMTAGK